VRTYVRDFARRLVSPSAIVLILGLTVFSAVYMQASPPTPAISAFVYDFNNGYHFLLFTGDESGHGVPDAWVRLTLLNLTPPNSSQPLVYWFNSSTDASGLARVFANLPRANYSVSFSTGNSAGTLTEGWAVGPASNYSANPGANVLQPARIGFLSTSSSVFVLWAGPNGSQPFGYTAWTAISTRGTGFGPPTVSDQVELGGLSTYVTVFPYSPPPPTLATSNQTIQVEILNASGGIEFATDFLPSGFTSSSAPTPQAQRVLAFLAGPLSLIVGLSSLGLGFVNYGRDRISRTLESILVRRITAPGILLSRYAASMLVMSAAVGLAIAVTDTVLVDVWRITLPSTFLLATIGLLMGEAAALFSLSVLFTRLWPSLRASISATILEFAGLGLGWSTLVTSYALGGVANASWGLALFGGNPFEFVQLAAITWSGYAFPSGSTPGLAVVPPGLFPTVLTTVAWIAAPLLAALAHAQWRD
jgi:hypothetical protein